MEGLQYHQECPDCVVEKDCRSNDQHCHTDDLVELKDRAQSVALTLRVEICLRTIVAKRSLKRA